jgi:hypothetical protein
MRRSMIALSCLGPGVAAAAQQPPYVLEPVAPAVWAAIDNDQSSAPA